MAIVGMLFDRGLGRFSSFAGHLQLVSGGFRSCQLVLTFINYDNFSVKSQTPDIYMEPHIGRQGALFWEKEAKC